MIDERAVCIISIVLFSVVLWAGASLIGLSLGKAVAFIFGL